MNFHTASEPARITRWRFFEIFRKCRKFLLRLISFWPAFTNPENIAKSIKRILYTNPGERVLFPGFGVGLGAYVFEPTSDDTIRHIKSAIFQQLEKWEPRIKVESIDVKPDISGDVLMVYIIYQFSRGQMLGKLFPFFTVPASRESIEFRHSFFK